jgi:hypothetical protein
MYPEEIKSAAIERCLKAYKASKKEIKKVFYIAGPYRAENPRKILENIRAAEKVAIDVWKSGNIALCPHLNSRFMDDICDDKVFLEGAIELMRRCDGVVLVPRWEESAGARMEVKIAERIGLPVYLEYKKGAVSRFFIRK